MPRGNVCGKAVAARLRVTGGAGHECNDERDDLPVVLCTEPVGRACPVAGCNRWRFSLVGVWSGQVRRLLAETCDLAADWRQTGEVCLKGALFL